MENKLKFVGKVKVSKKVKVYVYAAEKLVRMTFASDEREGQEIKPFDLDPNCLVPLIETLQAAAETEYDLHQLDFTT